MQETHEQPLCGKRIQSTGFHETQRQRPATSDELIAAMREYRSDCAAVAKGQKDLDWTRHMMIERGIGRGIHPKHAPRFTPTIAPDTTLRDVVSRFTEPPARNASRLEHRAFYIAEWFVKYGEINEVPWQQLLEAICGDAGEWLEKENG
jgi:hypothetical protein